MENLDLQAAQDKAGEMLEYSIRLLPNLILGVIVFAIFLVLARIVRAFIRRIAQTHRKSRNVGLVFGRLAQGAIVIIGFLVAATIILPSFNAADMLGALGIGGVAISFAFRDVLQNFLAGILILLTEPFRIGDQIIFKNFEGIVENIQTRATIIHTYDGRRVVIPNAELFTNSVTVNTAFKRRRLEYDWSISLDNDMAKTKQLILEALNQTQGVLSDPAPEVLLVEADNATASLRARWWIQTPHHVEALDYRDLVLQNVCKTLERHGVMT